MGREVRMVPPGWQHPRDEKGHYIPLLDGYEDHLKEFDEVYQERGLQGALEYWDGAPNADRYMLVGVPKSERTLMMMYEDTSEGTPISPAFATPEELAHWLADNNASAFGRMTATYQEWLYTCKQGWAMSAMIVLSEDEQSGVIMSGVQAIAIEERRKSESSQV